MKMANQLILLLLQTITIIGAVTSNQTNTSYDPAELLAKIFKPNTTIQSRQRGYGFVNFEDQPDTAEDSNNQDPGQYGLIDFKRDKRPLRFEDDGQSYSDDPNLDNYIQNNNGNRPLKFEDSETNQGSDYGSVAEQENKKKRKRRRRRKPKNGVLPYYPGADGNGLAPGRPEFQGPIQGGYGLNPYGNPGYPAQPYRRPRRPRPRPSLATEALSTITEALTSIARYDDYQCVPRLLCEAAGGGALSGNGVLQSIAGIQPLLALLSVYNGVSTSPLFVFGRAVFLGMTSKGNTGTCRYAYPQCPTDPEQLIHYLNNHNGGFFRFFSAPQIPNQNIEQFYNHLGQDYGIDPNSGQYYGLYPNDQVNNLGLSNQRPGAYDNQGQNYDLQTPRPYDRPGLYSNQNQASNYAYDYNNYGSGNRIRFRDNNAKIEKRIQNKPILNLSDDSFEDYDNVKTKWLFPENVSENDNNNGYGIRDSRTLKFPEGSEDQPYNNQKDFNRKGKRLHFPENQNNQNYYNNRQPIYTNNNNNRYVTTTNSYNEQSNYNYYNNQHTNDNRYQTTTYSYNNGQSNQNYYYNQPNVYTNNNNYKYQATKYHNYDYNPNNNHDNNQNYYNNRQNIYHNNNKYQSTTFNNEEYVFDHKHNFYVKKENNNYSNRVNNFKRTEDDGLNTVYVVRGNGDPNKPEIVKLRPGQGIY